jgi:hypothetical protein
MLATLKGYKLLTRRLLAFLNVYKTLGREICSTFLGLIFTDFGSSRLAGINF